MGAALDPLAHGSATAPARAFLHAVRQQLDTWLGQAVDAAAERMAAASRRPGSNGAAAGAPVLHLLRSRRIELVRAVASALGSHLDQHARAMGLMPPLPSAIPLLDESAAEATASARTSARPLRLTLISESQIDDEIETARIVQLIESASEVPLNELAALCSGLHGRPGVEPATVPLRPADCARALRQGAAVVTPDDALRPALLRALGQAMGETMREVYASQVQWLQMRGVQPASYRIRQTPGAPVPPSARLAMLAVEGLVGAAAPPTPSESMRELVQWARRTQPAPFDGPGAAPAELRLFDAPAAFQPGEGPLPRETAEDLMRGLFGELRRQAGAPQAMNAFLRQVESVAQRMACADASLWNNPQHPGWQLLDRLLAAGAVHDDLSPLDQRTLRHSLDAVVQQVERSPQIDAAACLAAADSVQSLASQLLESAAEPPAAEVDDLQRLADREELEGAFRDQVVQQLRSTPTSGAMRRFLVGPWTQTLGALAQSHGADSPEVAAAALVVDDLIRATATPGQRVSKAQRTVLLRQVADGLARAALPAPRVDAEMVELADILRNPPPHPEDPEEAWREDPGPTLPLPVTLDLHAGLPTVPLALPDGAAAGPDRLSAADWTASLQPGALCRLFLQGHWMTARLNWVGPGQRLFLFHSRHGGRSHSLTQRMLHKLREAGLATGIDDSLMRALAMDSLVRNTVV